MFAWQKIKSKISFLRRIPYKYYFVAGVLFVMACYIFVFREKTLAYNYSGETCSRRLILFPGIFRQSGSKKYHVSVRGGWSVAGKQLTATSLCVTPTVAPVENSSETVAFAPWAGWVGRFTYVVRAESYPTVDANVLKKPIPVTRDLLLPLSKPDATFSYQLEVNDERAACRAMSEQLACDVPALELEQGSDYSATLEKYFKGAMMGGVMSAEVRTLSPLSITESSIENDAMVYDKPKSVAITVDKPVKQADLTVWRTDGDEPTEIKSGVEASGQEVVVGFIEDLPRQATIEVRAVLLESEDGSTPLDERILAFKTSGGPSVTAVSAGSSGIPLGSQIVVTFDQELSGDQDLVPLVSVGGGATLQARRGNQLIFSTSGVDRCAEISIAFKPDIESPYAVAGQSAWQYKGRMRCYTVSSIGQSAQGRPIYAYHFGSSGPSVVYAGAIHGNEVSTKALMDRWIQELDANPGKIPSGKRVIVVPAINPDGVAAGKRENARNVDLNRNFAVSDWKKDIQHTNGSDFPGGGGETPMSEPETKAIAGFIAQQRPELVISYHSIGWMVISNQGGQANARANQYAALSGYRLSAGDSGEFGYQITGTADDYYREQLGVPSILIELGSHSYPQFEKNQAAMWAMLR